MSEPIESQNQTMFSNEVTDEDFFKNIVGAKEEETIQYKQVITAQDQIALMNANNNKFKLESLLGIVQEQMRNEKPMRLTFMIVTLLILFIEVSASIVFIVLLGTGFIKLSSWMAETFYVTTFLQIIGVVFIIAKNLFPKASQDILSIIKDLLKTDETTSK